MTNQQLYFAVGVPCFAVFMGVLVNALLASGQMRSNERSLALVKEALQADNRALQAEMKAFRVEMLAEFRTLNDKIDNATRQHIAEYHK